MLDLPARLPAFVGALALALTLPFGASAQSSDRPLFPDPFELSTSAEHVFVGGREIPEDSRHERLFERYRDLTRYRTIGR